MRSYELIVILSPEVSDEAIEGVTGRLSRFVTERGGDVTAIKPWGKRRLAYPIKRFTEGTYLEAHLNLEPRKTKELESNLLLYEEIIRHLLTRKEEHPSVR